MPSSSLAYICLYMCIYVCIQVYAAPHSMNCQTSLLMLLTYDTKQVNNSEDISGRIMLSKS